MIVHTQTVEGPIYTRIAEALEVGVSLRAHLGVLAPLLLVWRDDAPEYVPLAEPTVEHSIAAAEAFVGQFASEYDTYAIVYDARVTVDGGDSSDAVVVRVGMSDGEQGVVAMQRYNVNAADELLDIHGNIAIVGHGVNLLKTVLR